MNTQIFSDALSAIDDSFITEAAAYSRKGLLPKKVLSLAACAVVLFAVLFGLLAVLGNSTPVYADAIEIQPPFDGIKWGMTPQQVRSALGSNVTLNESQEIMREENDIIVSEWKDETVYSAPLGGNTERSILFSFTKEISYQGKTIPPLLNNIYVYLRADDIQQILDSITEDTKVNPIPGENGLYAFIDEYSKVQADDDTIVNALNTWYLSALGFTEDILPEFSAEEFRSAENQWSHLPQITVRTEKTDAGEPYAIVIISIGFSVMFPYVK